MGRAVSAGDEGKLLLAAGASRSPGILPLLVLSLDSGMRASEVQNLRHKDLRLEWKNGDIASGELIVSKSKTAAGTGKAHTAFATRACLPDFVALTFPAGQCGELCLSVPQDGIGRQRTEANDVRPGYEPSNRLVAQGVARRV